MMIQWFWCVALLPGVLVASSLSAHPAAEESAPLIDAVEDSLEDWARFAGTGDLGALNGTFVEHGPQWRLFTSESVDWVPEVGVEPIRFRVQESALRSLGSSSATVWALVEAARVGFQTRVYSWDFDLIKQHGRWMVWTVSQARSRPSGSAGRPGTTTVPSSTMNEQAGSATTATPISIARAPTKPDSDASTGIRLPAISAWITVVTLVCVAVAGYMAPRIDRRRGG
jgi:hypothetical protein